MLTRASVVLVSLVAALPAQADQPAAPLPPRVEAAARDAFNAAQAADDAGDLTTAVAQYRRAQQIAPHPNITYNLADVLRRKREPRGAAREYRAYLRQAPDATDRPKVEQLIRHLEATPGQLDVTVKGDQTVVFVDGKLQPPAAKLFLELPPGPHRFDAVTPISFRSLTHDVAFALKGGFTLTPPTRVDGNLIISGSGWLERATVMIDATIRTRLGSMVGVTADRHTIEVTRAGCTWSKQVTPTADGVLYVYVDVPSPPPRPIEPPRGKRPASKPGPAAAAACPKATVSVEQVRFAPIVAP